MTASNNDGKSEEKPVETKMSFVSTVLYLVTSIVGTGIFMTPNGIANKLNSIVFTFIIWILCGIVSLFGSLCYAELGLKYPSDGGEYTYFKNIYANYFGFAFAYINFLCIKPASIAILFSFFSQMFLSAFPVPQEYLAYGVIVVAIVASSLICALNIFSTYYTIALNDILAYCKFFIFAIFVGLAGVHLFYHGAGNLTEVGNNATITFSSVSVAMYSGMWAYDGFNSLGFLVNQIESPGKALFPASLIGMGIVVTFYAFINLSYFIVLGLEGLANTSNVAMSAAGPYFGKFSCVLSILVSLSALGTANSTAFSAPGIYKSAAIHHNFPTFFASKSQRFNSYAYGFLVQHLLTIFYLLAFNPDLMLNYFSGTSWLFYSLAFIAVIKDRMSPGANAQEVGAFFRNKFTIVIPVVAAVFGLLITVMAFSELDPIGACVPLGMFLSSFGFYKGLQWYYAGAVDLVDPDAEPQYQELSKKGEP